MRKAVGLSWVRTATEAANEYPTSGSARRGLSLARAEFEPIHQYIGNAPLSLPDDGAQFEGSRPNKSTDHELPFSIGSQPSKRPRGHAMQTIRPANRG